MTEHIEREALLTHKTLIPGYIGEFVAVRDIIEIPAADVVEVVRCKDCAFSYCPMTIKEGKLVQGSRRCDKARRIVDDMGFCDKGVRGDV